MQDSTSRRSGAGAILAIGFGTTVAMWAAGYFCRLFGNAVSPTVIFGLLLVCQIFGGAVAGLRAAHGVRTGILAGSLTGVLNLLIVGSLIGGDTPNAVRVGALAWVPGTLIVCALGGLVGATIGRVLRATDHQEADWSGTFATVAAIATFLLLAAGGLVTGYDEGLAVVDWPNTEGYNMFLYPLSRMTGGIYLEHAHRLLGSLVGLTALSLAIHTSFTEKRRWVKGLVWLVFLGVVIQGVLGGLRVTGRFTLSTDPEGTAPSVILAIIHGVFGQLVFGGLVVMAACRSRRWASLGPAEPAPGASTDRFLGFGLIALLIAQLLLGALVRHFTWALALPEMRYGLGLSPQQLTDYGTWALHLHITLAVVVILATVGVGVRAWGLYRERPVLPRLGWSILVLASIQLALGVAALIVTGDDDTTRRPAALDVAITTTHQVVGAALLAWAILILIWNYRLLRPPSGQSETQLDSPANVV